MAGQKHPTPTPGFGDRVFYETLLRQKPDSAMAQEWCIQYGVLPYDEAAEIYELVMARKQQRKAVGGGRIIASTEVTKPNKKKPKIIKEEGVQPDVPTSDGAGRVGSIDL